jgi:ribbon-helix-helix CopG family protein
VKRTQLYLDDDMARMLATVSRQRGVTISELVRECLREKLGRQGALDKVAIARRLAGVWKDRTDLGSTASLVRKLRKDARRQRLRRG